MISTNDAYTTTTATATMTTTQTQATETTTTNTARSIITSCNCSAGQYCGDTNESCTSANLSGICKNVSFHEYTSIGLNSSYKYYISTERMSWWDTKAACEANGLEMVTTSDLLENSSNYTEGRKIWAQICSRSDGFDNRKYLWASNLASNTCSARAIDCNPYYKDDVSIIIAEYSRKTSQAYALCRSTSGAKPVNIVSTSSGPASSSTNTSSSGGSTSTSSGGSTSTSSGGSTSTCQLSCNCKSSYASGSFCAAYCAGRVTSIPQNCCCSAMNISGSECARACTSRDW